MVSFRVLSPLHLPCVCVAPEDLPIIDLRFVVTDDLFSIAVAISIFSNEEMIISVLIYN